MQRAGFETDQDLEIRTPLLKLYSKQLRHHLDSVSSYIKSLAALEEVSPKIVASLCLQLIANEYKDYDDSAVVSFTKHIIVKLESGKINETRIYVIYILTHVTLLVE